MELNSISDLIEGATGSTYTSLLDIETSYDNNPSSMPVVPWWDDANVPQAWRAAHANIPTFLCPSHPQEYRNAVAVAALVYVDGGGSGTGVQEVSVTFTPGLVMDPVEPHPGITHYLGSTGYFGQVLATIPGQTNYFEKEDANRVIGVFGNRSKTRIRDIGDGASTTFLFGECKAEGKAKYTDPTAPSVSVGLAWAGCGVMWTSCGMDAHEALWHFSSHHAGSVLFCYADGSVHTLNEDIDNLVYRYLSGISDQQIVKYE